MSDDNKYNIETITQYIKPFKDAFYLVKVVIELFLDEYSILRDNFVEKISS